MTALLTSPIAARAVLQGSLAGPAQRIARRNRSGLECTPFNCCGQTSAFAIIIEIGSGQARASDPDRGYNDWCTAGSVSRCTARVAPGRFPAAVRDLAVKLEESTIRSDEWATVIAYGLRWTDSKIDIDSTLRHTRRYPRANAHRSL